MSQNNLLSICVEPYIYLHRLDRCMNKTTNEIKECDHCGTEQATTKYGKYILCDECYHWETDSE